MALNMEQPMRPFLSDLANSYQEQIIEWMNDNAGAYIHEYIEEHGLEVEYTVTDGDLTVVLQ